MTRFYCFLFFSLFTFSATAQWNPSTTTNLQISSLQSGDVIAGATTTGGTFIAFYSQVLSNFEMRVQYLDAQGNKQFGADGMVINNLPTGSATYVFNAIVDNNNNFIVAYNDQRAGPNGTVINMVTTAGTLPWGLNGIYLGAGLSPYPAVLSTGEIVVAWNNSNNRISYQKFSTSGVAAWSPAKEIFPIITGRQISRVQVVSHTSGKFGFVFQQRNGTFGSPTPTTLYEQEFDNDGLPLWTSPVALSNYVTANSTYYSVLSYNDLTYVGFYANPPSQNRFDAFLQQVAGDGSLPWGINGSDFATDPTPFEMAINIAYVPGSTEIWGVSTLSNTSQSQYGISIQKFNAATGTRLLTDNAKTVIAINTNGEQQKSKLALYNGTDPVFMFYDVTNKIYATRLDNSGSAIWNPSKVELGGTSNSKLRFNFTPMINNQAVAAWAETRSPSTFNQPFAQNITANGTTGPLPVTLISFKGILVENQVQLSWKTQTENNNKGFYVQRSGDGIIFNDLVFIASKSSSGNSNAELNYNFTDQFPLNGAGYYRLKQVDKDGRFVYSNIVPVNNRSTHITLEKVYPSPVVDQLFCRVLSSANEVLNLLITNAEGKIMRIESRDLNQGVNQFFIDVSQFAKGAYVLWLKAADGTVLSKTILK